MLCSDVMDYSRKVVTLEGSKNRDCLLKKLVHLVWMWMCVWVGGCVVCVYGGGWGMYGCVFVWVNGWLYSGFGSVTILVTLWPLL